MAQVQFNSYAGGPHGGGPVVLPQQKHPIGDIGDALGALGNVPGQIQQMQIKQALNQLLMKALTQPQETSQVVPGGIEPALGTTLEEVDMSNPPTGFSVMQPGQVGDMFTQAPDKVVQAPNPEYQATMNRLESVGPAFGMDFNKYGRGSRSIDDLIRLEGVKASYRKDLEQEKGAVKKDVNTALYDEKEGHEIVRQRHRERLAKLNADNKLHAQKLHDANIERINKDNRLSQEQRASALLNERTRHNKEIEGIRWEYNDIRRNNPINPNDAKTTQLIERLMDEQRNADIQFARLSGTRSNDPNVIGLMRDSVTRYNSLGEQLQKLDPNITFIPKKLEDVPWYKDLSIDRALGVPAQQLAPNQPPRKPPAQAAPAPKPEAKKGRSAFNSTEEYVKYIHEYNKRQSEANRNPAPAPTTGGDY